MVEQGCGSLSATAMRSGSVLGDLGVAQVGFSVGSPAAAEVVRRAWSNDLLYIFLLWCRGEFMGLQKSQCSRYLHLQCVCDRQYFPADSTLFIYLFAFEAVWCSFWPRDCVSFANANQQRKHFLYRNLVRL